MNRVEHKNRSAALRANRVRAIVKGTSERPRLTVSITNSHVAAQIIDDSLQHTLVSATTVGNTNIKGTMTDKAVLIGEEIANNALALKIKKVVFDRGSKKYHGRIKALAEAARKKGLEF